MADDDGFAWAREQAEALAAEWLAQVVERDLNPVIAAAACAMLSGDLCRMLADDMRAEAEEVGLVAAKLLLSRLHPSGPTM